VSTPFLDGRGPLRWSRLGEHRPGGTTSIRLT